MRKPDPRDATHLGFLGDRRARCGSRSLLKTPDLMKVSCMACLAAAEVKGAPAWRS